MQKQNKSNHVRINQYIALTGVCSRRQADLYIMQGRVRVNQANAVTGMKIEERDIVTLDGKRISPSRSLYLALNKPKGYTCTAQDRHAERKVSDLLPPSMGRLFTVGRLDRDSRGLLIVTNDGAFAQRIAHPKYTVEKEYIATIIPVFRLEDRKKIIAGIEDNNELLRAKTVTILSQLQEKSILSIILTEGKKRQLRRIFSALHYHILDLQRIRIGTLSLRALPEGTYRTLSSKEIKNLSRS
ncbi:MAG: pseudouridine synthase [Candidatus Ratteibacteria bacterium]